MVITDQLSWEEKKVFYRVDEYFKSPTMTLQDKIINALLIAQHELEQHNFSNESERLKIIQFQKTLDSLLNKFACKL
ncbi:MAG: hypothetical protein GXY49_12720 [Syntrophomonadaceae bacterium]|nr:hypothetical protein [Syntrophomonadaceae bacterium]